jgi:hypothetical protein
MTGGKHFKQEDFKIIGKSMKFLQNLKEATNPYTSIAYFYSLVGGEGLLSICLDSEKSRMRYRAPTTRIISPPSIFSYSALECEQV